MSKFQSRLLASVSMLAVLAGPAMAASSGSFAGTSYDHNCTINSSSTSVGTLNGNSVSNPINVGSISFKASAGAGTDLLITPSAVVGLFTDNKITSSSNTSTANVGVQVNVVVTPPAGTPIGPSGLQIAPNVTSSCPKSGLGSITSTQAGSCVTYDQRLIQISNTLFQNITNPTSNDAFTLLESTLSAHAFNFYMNVPVTGTYTIAVTASEVSGSGAKSGSVAACFGPATVTVQQVKNFSFNGGSLSF